MSARRRRRGSRERFEVMVAGLAGFGFAFGAFAGVGTMEGGHLLLGLALVGLAVVSGLVLVWVTSRQADRVRAEIEARDV